MLTLITGPMFSEKTTTLLGIINKFKIAKKKILVINHELDNRYSEENKIISHNKVSCQAIKIHDLMMIEDIEEFDAIFIDEGQFFINLVNFVIHCLSYNKKIFVAGLNGDLYQKPIGEIQNLLAYANNIILLKSICNKCGEDASYSKLIVANEGSGNINVGGSDKWEARCFNCIKK